ncbi:unnamed protein product, partial [Staurois parvus]
EGQFTLHAFQLLFFCIQNAQKVGYIVVNVIVNISACSSSTFRLQKKSRTCCIFSAQSCTGTWKNT